MLDFVDDNFVSFELISTTCHAAVFSSLFGELLEFSFTVSQKIDIISELRVKNGRLQMDTEVAHLNKVFCMMFFGKMLNSTGDHGYPCLIPTVVRKKSPTITATLVVASSYKCDIMTSINLDNVVDAVFF